MRTTPVLDYGVASTYFALLSRLKDRNSAAAALACVNGCLVLGLALLTDYPGGVFRKLNVCFFNATTARTGCRRDP